MRSSSQKQKALTYSSGDVICYQSFITRSTSLGVAKAGNLKLDFMAKGIGIHFFGLENIFRCYKDTKTSKNLFGRMDTKFIMQYSVT